MRVPGHRQMCQESASPPPRGPVCEGGRQMPVLTHWPGAVRPPPQPRPACPPVCPCPCLFSHCHCLTSLPSPDVSISRRWRMPWREGKRQTPPLKDILQCPACLPCLDPREKGKMKTEKLNVLPLRTDGKEFLRMSGEGMEGGIRSLPFSLSLPCLLLAEPCRQASLQFQFPFVRCLLL